MLKQIEANRSDEQPDDPKKNRKQGIKALSIEELQKQAQLGGTLLPCRANLTEGSNVITTSVDMTSELERGDILRFGNVANTFYISKEGTFDASMITLDRKWLEDTVEREKMFVMPQPGRVGKQAQMLWRSFEQKGEYQAYLDINAKKNYRIAKMMDKAAAKLGGEERSGKLAKWFDAKKKKYEKKGRRNENMQIFGREKTREEMTSDELKKEGTEALEKLEEKKKDRAAAAYLDSDANASSPWKQGTDEASGKPYWYNEDTGESTYEKPEELAKPKKKGRDPLQDAADERAAKMREMMERKKKGSKHKPKGKARKR